MILISSAANDRNERGRLAKSEKQAYDVRNEKSKPHGNATDLSDEKKGNTK